MTSRRLLAVCAVFLVMAGCGGDSAPFADVIDRVPETDNQNTPTESRVPLPLAVIVRDNQNQVVTRAKVQWSVYPGAGTVADSVSITDASGRAQMDFTAGRATGPYQVEARLAANTNRTTVFTVNATPAPLLSAVSPSTFTGGDVLTITGSNLGTSPLVEIGGAYALVSAASPTSVTVRAPVCLVPGQIQIRLRSSGAFSNTISGTFTSPGGVLQLAVGQYASIDPAQLAGCAPFPPAGAGGAEYLVVPQGTGSAGISADYRLAGTEVGTTISAPQEAADEAPPGPARAFHDFLRAHERELSIATQAAAPRGAPAPPAGAAAALAPPPKVGDAKEFRVCNKLDCTLIADFTRVQARAKYVGSHVAIFQDVNAPTDGFTDAEFGPLGATFNDVLYEVDTRSFGVEPDVDQNGIVYMLFTPVVNRLTPASSCASGIVTGFFFAIDIDPGYASDARANQAEVFYSLVPDPSASLGCTVPKSRIGQIVPTTFVHEFQHMISYGQHVVFRRSLAEDLWLNEALSHLAEELAALRMRELGDNQAFSDYVVGDLYDGFLYLKSPSASHTLYTQGGGSLAERGAGWLFLRWMSDKFGPALTRRLLETSLVGTENITSATGEPMTRLLSQWYLANYVSDLPGFTAPARLKYDSWAFRTTYASLNAQNPARFDRPFPLVPQVFNGGSFSVTGTLRAGSGDYFRIVQVAAQPGFTLRLTTPAGAALPAAVAARLNVVRIR